MATSSFNTQVEGLSTLRPPFFNGSDYAYWKVRMSIYFQSIDYDLWLCILNGPHIPTKKVGEAETLKKENEYSDLDKKKISLDARAMNILYCALDRGEFNRISSYTNAKEIWHALEITHEGTNQVKESKISMFVHNYELFKMTPEESISDMYTRFTNIINALNALGKSYTNSDLVRKILRSLPKSWEAKVTAIQEAKDLTKLPLEELLGSLMTHEIQMLENEDESKKKMRIALKSSISEDDDDDEEDIVLMTRKFKNFLKRKKEKRSLKYKRTLWHVNDESSSEEEEDGEIANMCLMAFEDDDEVYSSDDEPKLSYIELQNAFDELLGQFEKLGSKYTSLKKKLILISKEIDLLKNERDTLKLENDLLQQKALEFENEKVALNNKIVSQSKIIEKFTQGSKTLENILSSQRCVFDKSGLGYKPSIHQKYFKNYFMKVKSSCAPTHTCHFCNKDGHLIFDCALKKLGSKTLKKTWVPKGTKANTEGPKKAWVPKMVS